MANNDFHTLVGYVHISGKSKSTGQPYDGYMLHMTIPGAGDDFVGDEAVTVFVPVSDFDTNSYKIGDKLDVRFDQRGRIKNITPVWGV